MDGSIGHCHRWPPARATFRRSRRRRHQIRALAVVGRAGAETPYARRTAGRAPVPRVQTRPKGSTGVRTVRRRSRRRGRKGPGTACAGDRNGIYTPLLTPARIISDVRYIQHRSICDHGVPHHMDRSTRGSLLIVFGAMHAHSAYQKYWLLLVLGLGASSLVSVSEMIGLGA